MIAAWQGNASVSGEDDWVVEGRMETRPSPEVAGRDWGADLRQARGDFALLAATESGLVLGAGRAGGYRPLFAVAQKDWAAASTRLRALLQLVGTRPALDLDYLTANLTVEYPLSETATPYEGISRLPLGEAWVLRPGTEVERRSVLDALPRSVQRGTEGELAEVLRAAMEAAVARCTASSPRVALMFSGGVDSSALLALLDQLKRRGDLMAEIDPYTFEFETPDPAADRPYRLAVERRLGRTSRSIAPEAAAPFVRQAMVLDGAPCTDVQSALWFAMDDVATKHGAKKIMSGLGGDNVLEGDVRLLGEVARRGHPIRAVRQALSLRGSAAMGSAWYRTREFVLRPAASALAPDAVRRVYRRTRRRGHFGWMGPAFGPWIDVRQARRDPPMPTLHSSPAERYAHMARLRFLGDVATIRAQQEERMRCRRVDPLFDDDLLRTVASLPPLALMAGGYLRGLMRKSVADLLPSEVVWRGDKAFLDPAFDQMVKAAGGFEGLRDLAKVRRLGDLGLVEPRPFRQRLAELTRRPLNVSWLALWPVLAMEEFLRQYDEGWRS